MMRQAPPPFVDQKQLDGALIEWACDNDPPERFALFIRNVHRPDWLRRALGKMLTERYTAGDYDFVAWAWDWFPDRFKHICPELVETAKSLSMAGVISWSATCKQ